MASHQQVAHRWAQDEGRPVKGFNLFFERRGDRSGPVQTIFSHGMHWPIASFMTAPNGQRVALLREAGGRSISTSAHTRAVTRALTGAAWGWTSHQGYPVFEVAQPDPAHAPGGSEHFHTRNNEWQLERAADLWAKAKRRRDPYARDHDLGEAARFFDHARRYAETFGLPPVTGDLADVARLVAETAARAAEVYAVERAERAKREVERMAALRVEQAPDFAAWLADAPYSRCPSAYHQDEGGSAYVRRHRSSDAIKGVDGDHLDDLQTSMGASVPWPHALRAFRQAQRCRATGEAWKRNGHSIRVGHFQIDRIGADGSLWAGCHFIAWSHMEALAAREGLLTPA